MACFFADQVVISCCGIAVQFLKGLHGQQLGSSTDLQPRPSSALYIHGATLSAHPCNYDGVASDGVICLLS